MDSLRRLVVRAAASSGDSSLGPTSRTWFDFTLKFEEIAFGMIPTAMLILIAPLYLVRYKNRQAEAAADAQMWAKLVSRGCLALPSSHMIYLFLDNIYNCHCTRNCRHGLAHQDDRPVRYDQCGSCSNLRGCFHDDSPVVLGSPLLCAVLGHY